MSTYTKIHGGESVVYSEETNEPINPFRVANTEYDSYRVINGIAVALTNDGNIMYEDDDDE